jgi:hypothetical protein
VVPLVNLYRLGATVLTLLGVTLLGTSFVIGSDPAVLTADEPDSLREELRSLRSVTPGDFLFLNDDSSHRWVLGPGFAPPEEDGTWVRAKEAQLIFYLPVGELPQRMPLSLELSVSPLLRAGQASRTLTLRSAIDEKTVELSADGARVFVNLPTTSEQLVELVCDSLDNPSDEQSSLDVRKLCVKVYAMAVWTEAAP